MRVVGPVLAAAALLLGAGGPARGQDVPDSDALRALWGESVAFEDFLAGVRRREDTWRTNAARAEAPADLVGRAGAVVGPGWRILAVAEDWCGDSSHTVPYVAALARAVDGLEMGIVGSEAGRAVMESHRTPDGRTATPTFVLLDGGFEDRGCLVEKPPALQEWFLANPDDLDDDALYAEKYRRYEADAGRSTLEEVVAVLEAAAAGERRCQAAEGPDR